MSEKIALIFIKKNINQHYYREKPSKYDFSLFLVTGTVEVLNDNLVFLCSVLTQQLI